MAKAVIVTLADEVTDILNKKAGGWSQSFIATRFYTAKANLETLDVLKVSVVTAAWRVAPDNRTDWEHQFDTHIGVQFRAGPKTGDQATTKFDQLLLLVQQITDYFADNRPTLADCPLHPDNPISFPHGPYIQEHIETLNQFTSVIQLTHWKIRDPDA